MTRIASQNLKRRVWLAAGVAGLVALSACAPSSEPAETEVEQAEGPAELVVWTDPARQAGFEEYAKQFPDVKLDIQTLPEDPLAKILLSNSSGQGWPDVVWSAASHVPSLSNAPYDFALDLSDKVDQELINSFSEGSLSLCQFEDRLTCLRNDVAPSVLWVDEKLMEEFGYTIPTTWEEYRDLGVKVAQEHPGYSVGAAGNQWNDLVHLQPSRCPAQEVTGEKEVTFNLNAPECTRAAELVDALLEAGSMSPLALVDPQYVKEFGEPKKLLMTPGPIWYGKNIFEAQFAHEPGTMSVAPSLQWAEDAEPANGNVGGGTYVVSRHSEYQEAAIDLVEWMATGPYQTAATTVTLPAHQPSQGAWLDLQVEAGSLKAAGGGDLTSIVQEATENVWQEWDNAGIPDTEFGKTVPPLLATGTSMTAAIDEWAKLQVQLAEAAQWTVTEK